MWAQFYYKTSYRYNNLSASVYNNLSERAGYQCLTPHPLFWCLGYPLRIGPIF